MNGEGQKARLSILDGGHDSPKHTRIFFIGASLALALFHLVYWTHGSYWTFDYNMGTVAFSYRYGFISRALLGTCLEGLAKIFGTEVSARLINQFNFLAAIMLVAAVASFLLWTGNRAYRRFGIEAMRGVFAAGLLFETGVGFSTFFADWGRTDIFLLALTLLACTFLIMQRGVFAVPVIAAVCMLIHEGYLFMYSGILFALMAYRIVCCIEQGNRKAAVKYAVVFCCTLLAVAELFVYFYFFSRPNGNYSFDEIVQYTRNLIGNPTSDFPDVVFAIQNSIFGDRWTYFGSAMLWENLKHLFFAILLFAPFIALFCVFWLNLWKNMKKTAFSKLRMCFYRFLPLGCLAVAPLYFTHKDYWRWNYQICFYEFFLIPALIAAGDELVKDTFVKLCQRVMKCRCLQAVIFTYAALLGPFRSQGFFLCDDLISGFRNFMQLFGVF